MDARHESLPQHTLNQLIVTINDYIKDNIENLVTNPNLTDQVKTIGEFIYRYAEQDVDVANLLTKHNLLSIDVVFFPLISEIENQQVTTKDFADLIAMIKDVLQQKNPIENQTTSHFFQTINQICDDIPKTKILSFTRAKV